VFLLAVFVGLLAWPAVSVAPAKSGKGTMSGRGTMCVLHARLTAKKETTGSTSTAKGHTLIKVREDGTIAFKTQINNPDDETFIAGHIHKAPVGVPGPIVVPLFVSSPTSARHIKQSGPAPPNAGTTGADLCQNPSAYYVNYHTTAFPGGAIRGQLH
jgi:CHRD domain